MIGNLHFPEGALVKPGRMEAFCRPFLEQVGLDCGLGEMVADLPVGRRQLLAIARALSMNARILLMDEPTSSLFDDAVERLFGLIANAERARRLGGVRLAQDGGDVSYLATASRCCATVKPWRRSKPPRPLPRRSSASWWGGTCNWPNARNGRGGEVLLRVEKLTTRKLRGVSFELRRGEVLGVAGLVGAGRSELGEALFGLDRIAGGRHPDGQARTAYPTHFASSRRSKRAGAHDGYERRSKTARWLRSGASPGSDSCAGGKKRGRSTRWCGSWRSTALRSMPPSARSAEATSRKCCWPAGCCVNPDVLFLDDPTRGIDVAAKQDIYRIIDALAAAGKGVILVSSELPELLRCSDRILVLCEGRVTAVYDAKEATQEKIMASATE